MSELKKMTNTRKQVHHQLLATVSAAALLGFMATSDARAAEADGPIIWIDFSGQFDQLSDQQSKWVPDYMGGPDKGPLSGTFLSEQKPPKTGYDASAGIAFRPEGSDWVFSASVRFGRARQPEEASKSADILPSFWGYSHHSHYSTSVHSDESHMLMDFQVGRDVGLGSTISAGIRVADMRSRKDVHISSNFPPTFYASATNRPESRISHKFHGAGPSIAWNGSLPLVGDMQDGRLGFDWGVNAAILFGRQTTTQTTDGFYRKRHYDWANFAYVTRTQTPHSQHMRRQNATVPALGGFIAATYRLPNAKLSLGYRADWYFNALDGGVAANQKVNRGFFGPYASVSIGIGD